MKKLLTIILIAIVFIAKGQDKPLTGLYKIKHDTIYITKHDTVKINPFETLSTYTLNSNCKDSIINHMDKCALMTVYDFDKNMFQWETGYKCWDETVKVGKDCYNYYTIFSIPSYFFLKADKKTKITQQIVNIIPITDEDVVTKEKKIKKKK